MGFSIPIPNPLDAVKSGVDFVEDAGSAVVNTTEDLVETGGDVFEAGVDAAQTAAVKSFQFQTSLVRFGLEKSLETSLFVGGKTIELTEKGIEAGRKGIDILQDGFDRATHPGDPNPPAAQGLEFSETKSASDLAYNAKAGETYEFPDGAQWKVVDVSEDKDSGFRAIALQPTDPNDTRTIVAYAGTDMKSVEDWVTDAKQGVGLSTKQYDEAVDFADKWKAKEGDDVILTGHSLGGGLASYAAIKTDLHATAVNSAPLALNHLGFDVTDAFRITQYYVPGEALSVVNDVNDFDVRPGVNIAVQGEYSIADPRSVINNHPLDSVAPDIKAPKKVE